MSNSILFRNANQEIGTAFRMSDTIGQNVKRYREAIRPEMNSPRWLKLNKATRKNYLCLKQIIG